MNCSCYDRDNRSCIELVPIFSGLDFDEMMEIARITTERTYDKGEMIYMEGDKGEKLYVIHEGKVKITRLSDNGKEQVIRILGPGEFMGELSLFSPCSLRDNSEALDRTRVCIIHGRELKTLMSKYPTIAFKVLEVLSQRLDEAENLIENINLHGVERRLACLLLDMADDKDEITLNMNRKDMASHMGMSRETLSRKLTYFQDIGLIKQEGHKKIILLDREGLLNIE